MRKHEVRNLHGPAGVPHVMTIIEDDANDIGWLLSTQDSEVSPITRHRIADLIRSFKSMGLTVDTRELPYEKFVNMYYTRPSGSMTELWETNNLPEEKHIFIGRFAEHSDAITVATMLNAQHHEALAGKGPKVPVGQPKPQNGPQGAAKRRPRPGKRPGPARPTVTSTGASAGAPAVAPGYPTGPYDGMPVNFDPQRDRRELIYNLINNGIMPVRVNEFTQYPIGLEKVTNPSLSNWPVLMPFPGLPEKMNFQYRDSWNANEDLVRTYTDKPSGNYYKVWFRAHHQKGVMVPDQMEVVNAIGETRVWNVKVQWIVHRSQKPVVVTTGQGGAGTASGPAQGILRAAGLPPGVYASGGAGGVSQGNKRFLAFDGGDKSSQVFEMTWTTDDAASSGSGTTVAKAVSDFDEVRKQVEALKAETELQQARKRQDDERNAREARIREAEAREIEARHGDGKVGPRTFGSMIRDLFIPERGDFKIVYPETDAQMKSVADVNRDLEKAMEAANQKIEREQIAKLFGVPEELLVSKCTCTNYPETSATCPVHG